MKRLICFSLFLGVVLFQQQPLWSSLPLLGGLSVAGLILGAIGLWKVGGQSSYVHIGLVVLFWACIGGVWTWWDAAMRLQARLPKALEKAPITVQGVVESLPLSARGATRFLFRVFTLNGEESKIKRIWLAWYPPWDQRHDPAALPQLEPGQYWQLQVRLKQPHTQLNPGGRDDETRWFQQQVGATGYVKTGVLQPNLHFFQLPVLVHANRIRSALKQRLLSQLKDQPYVGVVLALAMGDRSHLDWETRTILRRTGTAHLLSISGLHISLAAALGAYGMAGLWALGRLSYFSVPRQKWMVWAGLFSAGFYGLLSGFSIPTQRALLALWLVAMNRLGFYAPVSHFHLLLCVVALLVLLDPACVLSVSFWLSFGAVSSILFLSHQSQGLAKWQKFLWIQLGLSVLLLPLSLFFFAEASIIGCVANLLAVPWLGMVVVPTLLLALLVPVDGLIWLVHALLQHMMAFLAYCADFRFASIESLAAPMGWCLLALWGALGLVASTSTLQAVLGWLGASMEHIRWVLAAWGARIKQLPLGWVRLGASLCLCVQMGYRLPVLQAGEFDVTVLDVGQGLAVVIQTAHATLIYDTGPGRAATQHSGYQVLLPFLHQRGVHHIDHLWLSHQDADHTAGVEALLYRYPVSVLHASFAVPKYWSHLLKLKNAQAQQKWCHAMQSFVIDQVKIQVFWPEQKIPHKLSKNDRSCVVKIQSKHGAVLLSGDISAKVERRLVKRFALQLQADVLVAAHHGSRSSSSTQWLEQVQPHWIIFSAGYRHRFGHPHPRVVERSTRLGIIVQRTDQDGAIQIAARQHDALSVTAHRRQVQRYWHQHF